MRQDIYEHIGGREMTTPEPELNVEAELDAILNGFYKMGQAESDEMRKVDILALIQQVSDQRVKGFAERNDRPDREQFIQGQEHERRYFKAALDQTLEDYLSHKEASE